MNFIGSAEELRELREKEKEHGIQPDPLVDAFMKVKPSDAQSEITMYATCTPDGPLVP